MATTNQWMIPQVGSRQHSAHVGEITLSIWKYSGLNNIWQRLLDEKFFHFAKQEVTLRIEVKYQPTNFPSQRCRRCNKSFTRAPQPSLPEVNVAAPRPLFLRAVPLPLLHRSFPHCPLPFPATVGPLHVPSVHFRIHLRRCHRQCDNPLLNSCASS